MLTLSEERKFHLIFARGSESSREREFLGTRVPANESSRERKFHVWNFRSRSESTWERKFLLPSMTYGCKIMVSLTLCHFFDHPVFIADQSRAASHTPSHLALYPTPD